LQAFEKKKLPPLSFPEEIQKSLKPGSGPGGRPPWGGHTEVGFSAFWEQERSGEEKNSLVEI